MSTDREKLTEIQDVLDSRNEVVNDEQVISRIEDILEEPVTPNYPRPPLQYEVVLIEDDYCIFWREHQDISKGDHEVLTFWASFGPQGNKAKHTADILNGRFPAI